METILITGARAPIALELARSFYSQGHKVLMVDSLHWTVARWSNTLSHYYQLPSPRYFTTEFTKKLWEIIVNEQVTHLIPTCEEAFYIGRFKETFPCKVWCSDIDLLNLLHNKLLFIKAAQPYFSVPETIPVTDFTQWNISREFVFKPVYSRFANTVIINKVVSKSFFSEEQKKDWLAQKRIAGKEICIYSIWDEGIMKAYVAYHPVYRAGKGAGIFFEPVHHPAAFERVKAFGQSIGYTGQLCFDVIVDQTETPWFIECNPRGTSGAHLIHQHLAEAFLCAHTYIAQDQQEYSVKYAMAILNPFSFLKKRVRQSKDVLFDKTDLLPFILQPLSLLEITYHMVRQRTTWLKATTHDIEWNGNED